MNTYARPLSLPLLFFWPSFLQRGPIAHVLGGTPLTTGLPKTGVAPTPSFMAQRRMTRSSSKAHQLVQAAPKVSVMLQNNKADIDGVDGGGRCSCTKRRRCHGTPLCP